MCKLLFILVLFILASCYINPSDNFQKHSIPEQKESFWDNTKKIIPPVIIYKGLVYAHNTPKEKLASDISKNTLGFLEKKEATMLANTTKGFLKSRTVRKSLALTALAYIFYEIIPGSKPSQQINTVKSFVLQVPDSIGISHNVRFIMIFDMGGIEKFTLVFDNDPQKVINVAWNRPKKIEEHKRFCSDIDNNPNYFIRSLAIGALCQLASELESKQLIHTRDLLLVDKNINPY